MPRVEVARPILQALLVRLYSKKVRLVVEKEPDEVAKVVPKKMKGSPKPVSLTHDEADLIDLHNPQLVHMLRYDWEYGKELIRDVYATVARQYRPARGTDLSEFEEVMQQAMERLDKENMHGLWYYLDAALRKGIEICESSASKGQPLQEEWADGQ